MAAHRSRRGTHAPGSIRLPALWTFTGRSRSAPKWTPNGTHETADRRVEGSIGAKKWASLTTPFGF